MLTHRYSFMFKALLLYLDYSEWSRQRLVRRISELEKVSDHNHVVILPVFEQKMENRWLVLMACSPSMYQPCAFWLIHVN